MKFRKMLMVYAILLVSLVSIVYGTNHVVISEVLYNAEGSSESGKEWIELYNPTSSAVNIGGWSLYTEGGSTPRWIFTFLQGTTIQSYGHLLIGDDGTLPAGLNPDFTASIYLELNNGGDGIVLRNNMDVNVDAVGWGGVSDPEFYEGKKLGSVSDGHSIERKLGNGCGNAVDTDNNTADFFEQENPNPQNSNNATEEPCSGLCVTDDDCNDLDTLCANGVCNTQTHRCEQQFEPSSTQCRASAGDCDLAEYCTGQNATCPMDSVRPDTYECRASAGECDTAEKCDGITKTCPANYYKQQGADCGICAACDGQGNCAYDEGQDQDCASTSCPDSCTIDVNPFTWDYADDAPNECTGKFQCSQKQCSYNHECRDNDANDGKSGVCGAECDQNSDCNDQNPQTIDICSEGCICIHKNEICNNSIDDDGDQLIDCADIDCLWERGASGKECCQGNEDCNDGLYCNGNEMCLDNECEDGVEVDCKAYNLPMIAVCNNTPDDNIFTWDYFSGFTSVCDEVKDACTTGIFNLTNSCDKTQCGAGCENDMDCDAMPNGICNMTICSCVYTVSCGDGILNQPTEECDDGNIADGDGCSSICEIEVSDIVDDLMVNYLRGRITYDGVNAPAGTRYTVKIISGDNRGREYGGEVDDDNVFLKGEGNFDTNDQVIFSSWASFRIIVQDCNYEYEGAFGNGGNDGIVFDCRIHPEINNIHHEPSEPTELDDVTVYANATDNIGIDSVLVYYSVNNSGFQPLNMASYTDMGKFLGGALVKYYIWANDTYGSSTTSDVYSFTVLAYDKDGDNYTSDADCDDNNVLVNPGAVEACNGVDDDCDGEIDEDLIGALCPLQDGVCAGSRKICGGTSGWLDCNTSNYGADYEEIEESCDGLDNDCDNETDEDSGDNDGDKEGCDYGSQPLYCGADCVDEDDDNDGVSDDEDDYKLDPKRWLFGDVNIPPDGVVNTFDLIMTRRNFGKTPSDPDWDTLYYIYDVSGDGKINTLDLILIRRNFT